METVRNSTCGQGTETTKARGEDVQGSSCAGESGRKVSWGQAGEGELNVWQRESLKALHGRRSRSGVCTSFVWPKSLWQLPCTWGFTRPYQACVA